MKAEKIAYVDGSVVGREYVVLRALCKDASVGSEEVEREGWGLKALDKCLEAVLVLMLPLFMASRM